MSDRLVRAGDTAAAEVVGGKGAGLLRLHALGLRVPKFVVLPTEVYRGACLPDVPTQLPPDVEADLDLAWAELGGGSDAVAVRSSAAEEDGTDRSYAGQMETLLNVRDRGGLSQAVAACWRSLHSDRARVYRDASGATSSAGPAMAVVIQVMVAPDASGVVFTVNAPAGRADEVLVGSVWGLGEGLVSGALDADTFVLDRRGVVRERRIASKTSRIVAGAVAGGNGTRREEVAPDLVAAPSLSDALLAEIVRDSLAAEAAAGCPLDLEFCVAGGTVHFLQARPVTAFVPRARPTDGHRQVWDNSNIVESYAGVTLPLTFSFIRGAYHAVYWQFCEVLGLRPDEIRRHDDVLSNMLGLVRGRVYYNLLHWYRLCSFLPGFRFNKGFMEGMMGLRTPDALEEPPVSASRRYLVELPRLVRAGVRAAWLQATLERSIRRFHREFEAVHARFAQIDFDALPPHECMRRYAELEREVLWKWKAPIVNDFSAMVFYGMLRKLTVAWGVDPEGSIQNALLAGQGRIESTQVSESLVALARVVAADEEFAREFVAAPASKALSMLRSHARGGPAFATYLETYGDRCIAELKLESVPTRDDPALCVSVLQGHVRRGTPGSGAGPAPRAQGSPDAASLASERLGWRLTRVGVPRRWIYTWVLGNARAAIRNRENQRLARTRAYGLVRRIFRSVGASLHRNGVLGRADDVFYLEVEEIRGFVDGASTLTDLKSLVRARRAEFDRWRNLPAPPDHFETWGEVHVGNAYEVESARVSAPTAAPTSALTGLGAFPGIVEATAVVLLEPDTSMDIEGRILVTYQTDPGWVVLFPSIRGLVVERGSMLSHSAIVAREMGIPAIVGVRDVVNRVRSGDRIRIDGARGTVEIVSKAEGS